MLGRSCVHSLSVSYIKVPRVADRQRLAEAWLGFFFFSAHWRSASKLDRQRPQLLTCLRPEAKRARTGPRAQGCPLSRIEGRACCDNMAQNAPGEFSCHGVWPRLQLCVLSEHPKNWLQWSTHWLPKMQALETSSVSQAFCLLEAG